MIYNMDLEEPEEVIEVVPKKVPYEGEEIEETPERQPVEEPVEVPA